MPAICRSRDDPRRLPDRPAQPRRAVRVLGGAVPAVAPGFIGMGRLLLLDGLLTFWVTLASFAAFEAVAASDCGLAGGTRRRRGRARRPDQGADPGSVAGPADLAASPADRPPRAHRRGRHVAGFARRGRWRSTCRGTSPSSCASRCSWATSSGNTTSCGSSSRSTTCSRSGTTCRSCSAGFCRGRSCCTRFADTC